MIGLLFALVGIFIFFLDTAFFPVLTSYTVMTDLSLFYLLYLFELKKEKSLILYLFMVWIKAIWVPTRILLPFIILYLVAFLAFIGILQITKISNRLTIGVTGLVFFTIEFFLFKQTTFSVYLFSLLFQFLSWICLTPLLSLLATFYRAKIKEKGVFV